jgi:hypothetical protein
MEGKSSRGTVPATCFIEAEVDGGNFILVDFGLATSQCGPPAGDPRPGGCKCDFWMVLKMEIMEHVMYEIS